MSSKNPLPVSIERFDMDLMYSGGGDLNRSVESSRGGGDFDEEFPPELYEFDRVELEAVPNDVVDIDGPDAVEAAAR